MIKDLTGQKFDRLLVLEFYDIYKKGSRWKCLCDCGKECLVQGASLTAHRTRSCGCLKKESDNSPKGGKDLTGQKFGHLTVIRRCGNDNRGEILWECSCDCGNPDPIQVLGSNLRTGHTTSCGCSRCSHGEAKIASILIENHIPVSVISNGNLSFLDKCKMIIAPSLDNFDDDNFEFDFFVCSITCDKRTSPLSKVNLKRSSSVFIVFNKNCKKFANLLFCKQFYSKFYVFHLHLYTTNILASFLSFFIITQPAGKSKTFRFYHRSGRGGIFCKQRCKPPETEEKGSFRTAKATVIKMNCLCNLFDSSNIWILIVIIILILYSCNEGNGNGCGCGGDCGCPMR